MEFYLIRTHTDAYGRIPIARLKRKFKVVDRRLWTKALASVSEDDEILAVSSPITGSGHVFISSFSQIIQYDPKTESGEDIAKKISLDYVSHIITYKDLTIFMSCSGKNSENGTWVYKGLVEGEPQMKLHGVGSIANGESRLAFHACVQRSKHILHYIERVEYSLLRIDLEEMRNSISTGQAYVPQTVGYKVRAFGVVTSQPEKVFILGGEARSLVLVRDGNVLANVPTMRNAFCMAATKHHIVMPLPVRKTKVTEMQLRDHQGTLQHSIELPWEKGAHQPKVMSVVENRRVCIIVSLRVTDALDILAIDHKKLHILGLDVPTRVDYA